MNITTEIHLAELINKNGPNPTTINYEKLISAIKSNQPNNGNELQEDIMHILYTNTEEASKIIDIIIELDPVIKNINNCYDFT
jgi:hypothetical protein